MEYPQEFSINNIKEEITDLVRTEIISETLGACKFLSEKLNTDILSLLEGNIKKDFIKYVKHIISEPEMKMYSGYFAYHGLVTFKSGVIVEFQIYSSLMKTWRELSKILYARIRLNPKSIHEFGTTESRLISLGHLLHIAECEITRLEDELNNPN